MITTQDKLDEARRELAIRQAIYPNWIDRGKISKETAAKRIAILQEIANDYAKEAAKERLL